MPNKNNNSIQCGKKFAVSSLFLIISHTAIVVHLNSDKNYFDSIFRCGFMRNSWKSLLQNSALFKAVLFSVHPYQRSVLAITQSAYTDIWIVEEMRKSWATAHRSHELDDEQEQTLFEFGQAIEK